jgi:hypothetical protein
MTILRAFPNADQLLAFIIPAGVVVLIKKTDYSKHVHSMQGNNRQYLKHF